MEDKFYKRVRAKERNPEVDDWHNTSAGNLYYFSDSGVWSCRDDRVSEEFPEFWYEEVDFSFKRDNPAPDYLNVEDMVERQGIEGGIPKNVAFDKWWFVIGSGVRPKEGQDTEEHSECVAEASWNAAIDAALKSSRAKIEKYKLESGEWSTRSVIIESSILKLKK